MTLIDLFLVLLSGIILLVISFAVSMLFKELAGMNRLFSWLKVQLVSFSARSNTITSEKDKQAIQETLNVCNELK